MKRIALAAFLSLTSLAHAGTLVAIGGALDPANEVVYRAVTDNARTSDRAEPFICVLGVASEDPEGSAEGYIADFESYGAASVYVDITVENAATSTAEAGVLEQLAACNGFFFVGGDQNLITEALLPGGVATPALEVMLERYRAGAVVAGTSAGAAMMSDVMIAGGESIDTLVGGEAPVALGVGLGFVSDLIMDQHFLTRGRFGRLFGALQASGLRYGVGVDENTAVVVPEDGPWQVVGESYVAVLERHDGETTISLLAQGDTFDPVSGEMAVLSEREDIAEVGPYYEAGTIFAVDVFAPNALSDLLTYLVDSPETVASGLGFSGNSRSFFTSSGVRVRLEKTEDTRGYWGRVDGADYAVERVRVVTEPIKVYVVPDQSREE